MRTRVSSWRVVLGGTVAALVAAGGVAYATGANPLIGPHGNINSCVPSDGGQVHIWKPGHGCSGGWQALSWAAAGATGPTGTTGTTGATGATSTAATTVDGETLSKLELKLPTPASGTSTTTLYSGNGLAVVANCTNTGVASLQANGPATADSELTVSGYAGTTSFGSQTATLGPSSLAALGPAGSGETTFSYSSGAGQIVSGQVGYQSAPSFSGYAGCAFFGSVIGG
jgi:hypothetical protein